MEKIWEASGSLEEVNAAFERDMEAIAKQYRRSLWMDLFFACFLSFVGFAMAAAWLLGNRIPLADGIGMFSAGNLFAFGGTLFNDWRRSRRLAKRSRREMVLMVERVEPRADVH